MAATARATAILKQETAPLIQEPPWAGSLKCPMLMAQTAMQMRVMTLESCSAKSSSFCWRGVLISSVSAISSLILPIAVAVPVPMTIPLALPEATLVPEKTMFFLSWLTALGSGTTSVCLITETDVSGDLVSNSDFQDVSRDNLNRLNLLDTILVRTDDLASLGLVFLESLNSRLCISLLPDTNKSVENENEQDDERFNKSCDGVIVFKEGQDKRNDGSEQQNFN